MTRRIGLLAASLVVAMLGTLAVFSYVNRVEAQALSGSEPVDVLVAVERIAAGTSATAAVKGKLVELTSMPRRAVPEGALADVEPVGAQTLVSDVFAGEVLMKAKFADQTARTGQLIIPKDKIALSVELGDPQRVAGFVVPGSEVAIFTTVDSSSASVSATATQAGSTANVDVQAQVDDKHTRLLLPRTSVIAVGPSTLRPKSQDQDEEGSDEVATAVLTVAVTQSEAERLIHSIETGTLYFGLLNSTSKTGPGSGVSSTTLFTSTGSGS